MKSKTRLWLLLAAITTGALLLAGCGSSDTAGDDAGEPSAEAVAAAEDQPTPTSGDSTASDVDGEQAAEPPEAGQVAPPRDPSLPFAVEAVYDPDAEPYLLWFSAFDPGTYRTGALGTPMSFTTTEVLNSQPNGGGTFVLSDISSRGPDDRDLVFMRAAHLSNPAAPGEPIDGETLWPADDFLGWLDNLHEGVIATDPVNTSINGRPAIRVDLELSDDMGCGWIPGFCVGLAENNGEQILALNPGASYRVWVIDQADEDPLLAVAGIARDEQLPWFDRAEAVLDTVAFGDIAPNPAQFLTPGPARLNTLGGVQVELPENVADLTNDRSRLVNMWAGRGFAAIPITDRPGAIYFSDRPHDVNGVALETADEVVAELTSGGAELTELDAISIDGVDTRVFDVTTEDPGAILLRFSPLDLADAIFGWDAPAAGRVWLIEHPERGLMMISTHAFDDVDTMLPTVNELGEAIVGSLTFAG